jgi:membrane protein DedA with SNARE-associated domain
MLITAAVYAGATHNLTVEGVIGASTAGAIIGDNIGFMIGYRGGYRLLLRYGPRLRVNQRHLKVARLMFDRYGGRVVFFGRFVSILRTYAAFFAGVSRMHWRRFFVYNAAGGIVWSVAFGLAGYYGGAAFKKLSTPIDIALGVAAVVLIVGVVVFIRRHADRLAEVAEKQYPGPLTAEN